jgi:hypothetical protein
MSSLVRMGDTESMRNALCVRVLPHFCLNYAHWISYRIFLGSQAPYPGSEYLSDPPIAHDNATKITKALVLSPQNYENFRVILAMTVIHVSSVPRSCL